MSSGARKRVVVDRVTWITGLGLGLTLAMQATTLSYFDFTDIYAVLTTISRIFALVGTYLALIGLLLIARIPWVENSLGHDRLIVWHRKAMPYALFLISFHVLTVVIASAGLNQEIIGVRLWKMVMTYEWLLPAFIGFILLITAGISSYKRVRRKMKYETWWVIHIYTYLAVALSFMHQLLNGTMFINHPLNQAYWISLYIFVFVNIVIWRIWLPLFRSLRHQLKVAKVVVAAPGIVSIYISGKNLNRLNAQGGQFFNWRFLTRDRWLENHPFSLSASPESQQLRITVKALGDSTADYLTIPVGTRVMIEGPYGIFTKDVAHQDKYALLIAGGAGITPIRALIDELDVSTQIDLIFRASNESDFLLRDELEELSATGRINLILLPGSRKKYPITAETLRNYSRNFADSDVYICGPESLVEAAVKSCKEAGIPSERVHRETFEYHSKLEV